MGVANKTKGSNMFKFGLFALLVVVFFCSSCTAIRRNEAIVRKLLQKGGLTSLDDIDFSSVDELVRMDPSYISHINFIVQMMEKKEYQAPATNFTDSLNQRQTSRKIHKRATVSDGYFASDDLDELITNPFSRYVPTLDTALDRICFNGYVTLPNSVDSENFSQTGWFVLQATTLALEIACDVSDLLCETLPTCPVAVSIAGCTAKLVACLAYQVSNKFLDNLVYCVGGAMGNMFGAISNQAVESYKLESSIRREEIVRILAMNKVPPVYLLPRGDGGLFEEIPTLMDHFFAKLKDQNICADCLTATQERNVQESLNQAKTYTDSKQYKEAISSYSEAYRYMTAD